MFKIGFRGGSCFSGHYMGGGSTPLLLTWWGISIYTIISRATYREELNTVEIKLL